MHDEATYTLIERYLAGECTPEETAMLEERMAQEPEFAELVDLHRDMDLMLTDEKAMAFSEELEKADREYHAGLEAKEKSPRRLRNWRGWAIAASFILLAVVGGVLLLRNDGLSGPEAFNASFIVYDAPANFRGDSSAIGAAYGTAFAAYQEKDWKAAIDGFEQILVADSGQVTARFYGAVSLLANGDTDKAIQKLEDLAKGEHPFVEQSKWYWAM